MRHVKQFGLMLLLALTLLLTCVVVFAAQGNPSPVQAAAGVPEEDTPTGGFTADGDTVNAVGTNGATPVLAINQTGEVWTALSQTDQIIVTKFNPTTKTWVQQGGVLNSGAGSNPALALGDADGNTAWVAWTETTNNRARLMTARFTGSSWQPTGEVGQHGGKVALTTGAIVTGTIPHPWLAWATPSGIVVKRAVSDTTGLGGVRWESVGVTLTIAPGAAVSKPDLIFAGTDKNTPWLTWVEADSDGNYFVFAARAVIDSGAAGGFHWEPVGKVAICTQATCNLTNNSRQVTLDVHLAAGALIDEDITKPWLVFATEASADQGEIRVMRLDDGGTPAERSDDRFIPAGGAINSQCLDNIGQGNPNGSQPDIFFVGAVPHIAWIETQAGVGQLFVCHLADTRPGQERWDLDTVFPINHSALASAAAPALSATGNTPYVAWQEGDNTSNVFVAHRYPDGPAWGSNRPPFIRTISWSRNLVGRVYPDDDIARAIDALAASTNPLTLTTSCDHVNGWEHIREIQFKVANKNLTAFSGKYVAAEDKVYVEDPAQPGTFLGGVKPGSSVAPITTAIATLYVANMRVRSHGNSSPVLDIDWIISFKEPTMFQDLKQMINIVYDDGQATGFFATGMLSFDYRIYMPVAQR